MTSTIAMRLSDWDNPDLLARQRDPAHASLIPLTEPAPALQGVRTLIPILNCWTETGNFSRRPIRLTSRPDFRTNSTICKDGVDYPFQPIGRSTATAGRTKIPFLSACARFKTITMPCGSAARRLNRFKFTCRRNRWLHSIRRLSSRIRPAAGRNKPE